MRKVRRIELLNGKIYEDEKIIEQFTEDAVTHILQGGNGGLLEIIFSSGALHAIPRTAIARIIFNTE